MTTLKCSRAQLRYPHAAHGWEPQPGVPPVHCPGHEGPARPALETLDAAPEPARWCCSGNAEDCPLCDTAALPYPWMPYPWICPDHPDTEENRQRVQEAAGADRASEAAEVQRLRRMIRQIMTGNRRHADRLTDAHQATIGELRRAEVRALETDGLRQRLARLRQQWAAEGPPPGVSRWWDQRLAELDTVLEPAAPGAPVRHVHVTITNPDEYTANRAALSLADWVRAEFGDSLNLHVTTDAREWDADGQEQS